MNLEGEVVRNLAPHGDDNAKRFLHLIDVQYRFQADLVEVEFVALVIIGAHRFRIIIDHDSAVA